MTIQQSMNTISRRSLHVELVDRISDMIIAGELAPGTKIPEQEMCKRFGVSRTPMREALKVLAADGLVSLEPNRGAWVSKITLEELEEVFPVMGALEALSGELACERITDKEIDDIKKLHNRMLKYYKSQDLARYFQTNQEIHEAILNAAKNTTLSLQYRSLASRVRRARYMANMSEERWKQAVEEHEQILMALEKRQGSKLARILKRHLKNKFETVRSWLAARD